MVAQRTRSSLLAALVLAAVGLMAVSRLNSAFVPGQQVPAQVSQLRGVRVEGALAASAAAAAAAAPLAASAADELVQYNMAGEFTEFFVVGYFGLTTAFTVISFLSYLILTKLKII
eukprot:CAMPEP_0197876738 /NCGR_PEP_ID=MMETSP1439-20131203/5639_1 /TAXON_ID=66791 /ORGANISM="Gonyaulax spinifera, Strain CCMP409" /LENGTH=115 /DNA_ID=CAMNT_0043496037 /DNA_START=69 /DNA_END=416 /DNA_ORIENTATION=-